LVSEKTPERTPISSETIELYDFNFDSESESSEAGLEISEEELEEKPEKKETEKN